MIDRAATSHLETRLRIHRWTFLDIVKHRLSGSNSCHANHSWNTPRRSMLRGAHQRVRAMAIELGLGESESVLCARMCAGDRHLEGRRARTSRGSTVRWMRGAVAESMSFVSSFMWISISPQTFARRRSIARSKVVGPNGLHRRLRSNSAMCRDNGFRVASSSSAPAPAGLYAAWTLASNGEGRRSD